MVWNQQFKWNLKRRDCVGRFFRSAIVVFFLPNLSERQMFEKSVTSSLIYFWRENENIAFLTKQNFSRFCFFVKLNM